MAMSVGIFELCRRDGTRIVYLLLKAELSCHAKKGTNILTIHASARPLEWNWRDGVPEPPSVEISVRVPGLLPSDWMGQELAVPKEPDVSTGRYQAWLYHAEDYEPLMAGMVCADSEIDGGINVRISGYGGNGNAVRITGRFTFAARTQELKDSPA